MLQNIFYFFYLIRSWGEKKNQIRHQSQNLSLDALLQGVELDLISSR